jgi:hypothetical protein
MLDLVGYEMLNYVFVNQSYQTRYPDLFTCTCKDREQWQPTKLLYT